MTFSHVHDPMDENSWQTQASLSPNNTTSGHTEVQNI